MTLDTFNTRRTLTVDNVNYDYFSLIIAEKAGLTGIQQLPFSLKILLENLLRHEDGQTVTEKDIQALAAWLNNRSSTHEIAFRPARVLMQDFTGVPAVVDLAAMRDALKKLGGNPERINPLTPVDLVIDHSLQADFSGSKEAFHLNADLEMKRNNERYSFLRWGQQAFQNFKVVPPDTGICHQINLEFLAQTVWSKEKTAFPDTLVGTDSHTTMINGLGVLGWGVGGIEAEAAMLGQPISMLIPEVIGVKLIGVLPEGVTATDLVLTITQILRQKGVVGKFVEFFGPGLPQLSLTDRATIANMAPEYGATCGFFPIDKMTIDYLRLTGRDAHTIERAAVYAKAQGLWHDAQTPDPIFTEVVTVDLSTIEASIAGPKRPQDRVGLAKIKEAFPQFKSTSDALQNGSVVIAAITSCTNTSNPSVLMAAGLLAKKAVEKGLKTKPWVKATLAPGSQVVSRYLEDSGLQPYLDALGFSLIGFGCTTCIGNSGPLTEEVSQAINEKDLLVSAVLSGNRNFEGRIHPQVKANWLASPPLVIAFALAGTTQIDLTAEPIGFDSKQNPVFLADIWPTSIEITDAMSKVTDILFKEQYANVFSGNEAWNKLPTANTQTYSWETDSTYIQHPPFFSDITLEPHPLQNIQSARILALLGDSITTDHISPAGSIKKDSPAGRYLLEKGVSVDQFNSLGARRGNHEVMMRGTFANIRIKNEMADGKEGGFTKHIPSGEILSIYDAAMRYQAEGIPLIVIAGKEYGTGSSRDWAAKGPKLLGVKAVIAESFERIHRSNLIGMGILPLEFTEGMTRKTLSLTGNESIDLLGLTEGITPRIRVKALIHRTDGSQTAINLLCRIDTVNEADYYRHGGILQYVLRGLVGV